MAAGHSSEIHLPIFPGESSFVHARRVISSARQGATTEVPSRAIAKKFVSMFEQTIHDRFTIIEPYVRGREVMDLGCVDSRNARTDVTVRIEYKPNHLHRRIA